MRESRWHRIGVACGVAGGAIWVLLAAAILASTVGWHRTVLASSGSTGFDGYPPAAVTDLIYATYYYCLFLAGGGILAIAIALYPLRSGARWAWYATTAVAVVGSTETVLDGVLWSGWWVFPVYAMMPLLAVLLTAPRALGDRPAPAGAPIAAQGPWLRPR